MIDWQIEVNGVLPQGWDPHRDGCWFPDFDTQAFLLPWFNVGEQPIDEYGSTRFDHSAVRRLRIHLEWYQDFIEAKPAFWRVEEVADDKRAVCELKRDVLLQLIERTIAMTERAESLGGELVFRGD